MTTLNLFRNPKKELEAERAQLERKWQELSEKEIALRSEVERTAAEKAAAELRARRMEEYGRIHNIATDRIIPNPSQPRKQFEDDSIIRLADSIRQYGILQPLTVRRIDDGLVLNDNAIDGIATYSKDMFEIVAGERRLRASKLLQLATVPCIIVDVDSKKSAELAIIENIQRENLNIFEQASSIASLIDIYSLTQEEVAKQLSMSQSFVANKLRILRLTAPERELILKYNLTERHARALLKIDSVEQRIRIIEYINSHQLNVATTEAYIDRFMAENASAKRHRSPRRIILKDIRIFYNSIDKAVSLVRQAGIPIESERNEADDAIEVLIRIPKANSSAH
ncbi:MAG: ParB/RepB/Spo0J family partition protein [Clostridiales bacterium]|nr:ParB/RepB/Spo0J family partition protein [Clostridiales bacterium]